MFNRRIINGGENRYVRLKYLETTGSSDWINTVIYNSAATHNIQYSEECYIDASWDEGTGFEFITTNGYKGIAGTYTHNAIGIREKIYNADGNYSYSFTWSGEWDNPWGKGRGQGYLGKPYPISKNDVNRISIIYGRIYNGEYQEGLGRPQFNISYLSFGYVLRSLFINYFNKVTNISLSTQKAGVKVYEIGIIEDDKTISCKYVPVYDKITNQNGFWDLYSNKFSPCSGIWNRGV